MGSDTNIDGFLCLMLLGPLVGHLPKLYSRFAEPLHEELKLPKPSVYLPRVSQHCSR